MRRSILRAAASWFFSFRMRASSPPISNPAPGACSSGSRGAERVQARRSAGGERGSSRGGPRSRSTRTAQSCCPLHGLSARRARLPEGRQRGPRGRLRAAAPPLQPQRREAPPPRARSSPRRLEPLLLDLFAGTRARARPAPGSRGGPGGRSLRRSRRRGSRRSCRPRPHPPSPRPRRKSLAPASEAAVRASGRSTHRRQRSRSATAMPPTIAAPDGTRRGARVSSISATPPGAAVTGTAGRTIAARQAESRPSAACRTAVDPSRHSLLPPREERRPCVLFRRPRHRRRRGIRPAAAQTASLRSAWRTSSAHSPANSARAISVVHGAPRLACMSWPKLPSQL